MNLLVTRPEHDDTTHYLSSYCEPTLEFAHSKGHKVLDLHREKAVKMDVESGLRKFQAKFVVFNGHGDYHQVAGHKNEVLITEGENDKLLKDKVVYAISCRCGNILGPRSVEKGALSFTGYNEDFYFYYEPKLISKPKKDKTVALFLEPTQRFIRAVLKGNSVQEAEQKAQEQMKDNLIKSLSFEDTSIAKYLWWDLKHMVTYGNKNMKLD